MKKPNWDDVTKEPMGESLKHRTLARAREELLTHEKEKSFSWSTWLFPVVPALAALLFFTRNKKLEEDSAGAPLLTSSDKEVLNTLEGLSETELDQLDPDLIANLDFYLELDILEEWDGTDES